LLESDIGDRDSQFVRVLTGTYDDSATPALPKSLCNLHAHADVIVCGGGGRKGKDDK
jgi:hypothetical protein